MRVWRAWPAVVLALIGSAANAQPDTGSARLELICTGTARYQTQSTTTGTATNSYGATANGRVTTTAPGRSQEQYRVIIEGAGGKVKVPRALQPNLGGPGLGDNWWALRDVSITADRISARWQHNIIEKPKMVIDRRTGDIEVSGLIGSFSGTCERAPDEPETRRF